MAIKIVPGIGPVSNWPDEEEEPLPTAADLKRRRLEREAAALSEKRRLLAQQHAKRVERLLEPARAAYVGSGGDPADWETFKAGILAEQAEAAAKKAVSVSEPTAPISAKTLVG